MADAFTTNYNLTKPEVGFSVDTWGTKLNQNADAIDAQLKSSADNIASLTDALDAVTAGANELKFGSTLDAKWKKEVDGTISLYIGATKLLKITAAGDLEMKGDVKSDVVFS